MIIMAQETLLFRWAGFSPALWLLIPTFSLDNAPPCLTTRLRRDINAPLPVRCYASEIQKIIDPIAPIDPTKSPRSNVQIKNLEI